ncbi:hypothetical protein DFR50_10331 [Roseiarcus fermentans]|uniref:Uncharacterized protein n=1 Tax=Roseiarcus fermentans TaxID=1473586 RepID=A0A366FSM3_9HYPH|nr:hypothetical protein DFR50_10331 [Roseiarcus fermentans]
MASPARRGPIVSTALRPAAGPQTRAGFEPFQDVARIFPGDSPPSGPPGLSGGASPSSRDGRATDAPTPSLFLAFSIRCTDFSGRLKPPRRRLRRRRDDGVRRRPRAGEATERSPEGRHPACGRRSRRFSRDQRRRRDPIAPTATRPLLTPVRRMTPSGAGRRRQRAFSSRARFVVFQGFAAEFAGVCRRRGGAMTPPAVITLRLSNSVPRRAEAGCDCAFKGRTIGRIARISDFRKK